jgi:hypothetical protein
VGGPGELGIPGYVVAVPAGVRHDQLIFVARVFAQPPGDQPVDRLPQREPSWIGGSPRVPWIQLTSSDPVMGAPLTKSIMASFSLSYPADKMSA